MLVKWNPIRSLVGSSLLDDFMNVDFSNPRHQVFAPSVEINETENNFEITAELPGLDKDDFKITLEDNILKLEGEKKIENEEKREDLYRSERSYGRFSRSFRLTDGIDSKKISADYKNGILKISLPKAEKAKPKEVAINVK